MIDFKNFDEYVAIESETISKQVRIFNSRIGVIKEWNTKELELYLYKDGKLFTTTIENPDDKKIKKAVKQAEEIIKKLPEIPFKIGSDKNYINEKYFDEKVIDEEKMVDKVNEALNKNYDEVAGVLFSSIEKKKIYTPYVEEEDKNSMTYLSLRVFKKDMSKHFVSCSRKIDKIDVAKEEFDVKEIKNVKEGEYNVLLSPLAFANLIHYFANFSSAFAVDAGYSFLEGKIGKRIGSEKLTIYDSGIEKDGLFSTKFDDEGVATRKTIVVEDGILRTYLHNSTTAMLHKTETTGNAGIIAPNPWNTIVRGGDANFDEMLQEVKNGIYITNVWYTRFHNYKTGDFSTVARDAIFFIKNGEIKHALKNVRISDNLERMLKNIEMLSKEIKQIYWWEVENPVFCPYAMIRNVRITTA